MKGARVRATLDCLECIAAQALRAARIATEDEGLQRRIFNAAVEEIPRLDMAKSPAELSLVVYESAAALSENRDPYLDLKRMQNERAMALEPELRRMVAQSADPLSTALHLAAAGNVIDLGVQGHDAIDVRGEIERVMAQGFAVDHSHDFRRSLAKCANLLYLLDNAGEIVFDKILIGVLQRLTSVTAVVKAAPMINDALLEDAEQVGLTRLCEVIDNGGAFVGSPLDLVPRHFLDRLQKADIIIGKGQGNYETMDEFPGDVFLILKAKCEVIARDMGVQHGQVAMISTRRRRAERENPQPVIQP